jgi:hypothetical protein
MSHLSLETIARLVDEQPSALDNAHLEACAACRAELAAMRADVVALGSLPDLEPSPSAWADIEARLEAEGLLQPTSRFGAISTRTRTFPMLARAAAVAVIFLGGALVGRALQDAPPAGPSQQVANADAQAGTAATTDAQNATSDVPAVTRDPQDTQAAAQQQTQQQTQSGGPVRLASTGNAARNRSSQAMTSDEALADLRAAEDRYFSALSTYSQKAGTATSDPTARLAALEGIVLTTRAALAQAPTDPVINGYHLTALAQRDAMLKQIKATPATSW